MNPLRPNRTLTIKVIGQNSTPSSSRSWEDEFHIQDIRLKKEQNYCKCKIALLLSTKIFKEAEESDQKTGNTFDYGAWQIV